jgi:hypothetical protein
MNIIFKTAKRELSCPATANRSGASDTECANFAFEYRIYLREFEAEFKMASSCESGAQGNCLMQEKSRVENLETLSL